MPVIRVEMFKRTQEQKRDLARELTNAFINTCGGNKEAIKILITEVDAEIRLLIDLKNLDENLIAIVIDMNNSKVTIII